MNLQQVSIGQNTNGNPFLVLVKNSTIEIIDVFTSQILISNEINNNLSEISLKNNVDIIINE